jgi:hypothetical protein
MAVVREAIEKELRGGGGVGANISRARERMNGLTYGVVRLATHAKADCDDNGVVDGWGVRWGGWWETAMEQQAVTQMEEWLMGHWKEHDRTEIVGLREAMECEEG